MKRVIGIGGIFFKANDPEKLAAWYKKHLGLDVQDWGGVSFQEGAGADLKPKRQSHIVWSPFEANRGLPMRWLFCTLTEGETRPLERGRDACKRARV